MNNQLKLNIKTPCTENFNQFSPTPQGGFCGSCQKEVIDFTKMNSEDITTYFNNKQTKNTCGRFNTQQLKTPIISYKKNKYLSFVTGIGLTILSFFSVTSAEAQDLEKTTNTLKSDADIETTKDKENITVKGTVLTKDDGLPLPGASVILQGTAQGVQTDFDGNFEFPQKLKKGDVLIISYIGLESQKIVIENKKSASKIKLKVNMEMTSCVIMGKVAVKQIFKSNKN